ncbi:MAG: tRNA 2-selenouridine(34) synthase MnmH [Bacteroidota bacterium]|jgi:tRNA 2-selenouridine synthase
MAVNKITVDEFIRLSKLYPVIDVRSESEYKHAHVPGANNLSLFNDEERKVVGTIYKQQSREQAIKKGLEYFGPKMKEMILFAERINRSIQNDNKTFIVHCWRGGMRSAAVAWLLDMYGFKVYTLIGGYKAFRNWVLEQFTEPCSINIVGGYTGSGKTIILQELKKKGEAIIDLEGIAGHRGSAFGRIGLPEQTSVEMFENKLALELIKIKEEHPNKTIWVEDESQRIGAVSIPQKFWEKMRQSLVYFIDIPFEKRLAYIIDSYGILDLKELAAAISRIEKKLGGLETKTAIEYLNRNDFENSFKILLKYYDKLYLKSLRSREIKKDDHSSSYVVDKESEFKKGMNRNLNDEYSEDYKIQVNSEQVDSQINAIKLLTVFYGRN